MLGTSATETDRLHDFEAQIERLVHEHPIVVHNAYTKWFSKGDASLDDVRRFTQQFSVFSHQFVVAQLLKVIHSNTLESYRLGKEILMNELGVVFRRAGSKRGEPEVGVDPNTVGVEGTVDGSTFRHAAAHFEWLVDFAKPLGLPFEQLGRLSVASEATRSFSAVLRRTIGSEDPSLSAGASFAIENWAVAGIWKELIQGLERFKRRSGLPLNLGFWIFHDKLEDQHAAHTHEELEEDLRAPWFSGQQYEAGAREVLNGVKQFWDGLGRPDG